MRTRRSPGKGQPAPPASRLRALAPRIPAGLPWVEHFPSASRGIVVPATYDVTYDVVIARKKQKARPMPHPTRGDTNRSWWPARLNLKVLAQNPACADPMGAGF